MELNSVTIIRYGVHFCWTKTLKRKSFSLRTVLLLAEGAHLDGDRDHVGGFAQHAHDAAVAVLVQRADDLGGVGHLVGLELRGEGHEDLALAHGHIDGAEVEERVAEGQHALAVVIGDGAEPGHAHVAGNQHAGDGVARFERSLPAGGGLGGVNGAARAALHDVDAELAGRWGRTRAGFRR